MLATDYKRPIPLTRFLQAIGLVLGLFVSTEGIAGSFVFSNENNGVDLVTHPGDYTGSGAGGIITVRVCIKPGSPNATDLEIPIQNNINIYNRLQPTTGNIISGGNNNVPSGQFDLESVALHEMGHCLGLAHANMGTGFSINSEYTYSDKGIDNTYNASAGPDVVIGSSDDVRGDDSNLHWFRKSNNNPFTIDSKVDSTTYSVALADLPTGHTFAANGSRALAAILPGTPNNTEAVMQQGTAPDEAQRTLTHDGVATLLYAASGIDEKTGSPPPVNNDDYTLVLEYGGISTTNCDINISVTNTSSVAFCDVRGSFIGSPGSGHALITFSDIEFGSGISWFFNTETVNQAPALNAIGNQTVTEGQSSNVGITASDADNDGLTLSATGLPAFASLTDNGNGNGTLSINPAIGDAGTWPVTVNVMDDGLPALTTSENFDIIIDPVFVDTDGDGISDSQEIIFGTDPNLADTDGDGIDDGVEIGFDGDPNTYNPYNPVTNPTGTDLDANSTDTDGDGLDDKLELDNTSGSEPVNPNTWPNFADANVAPHGNPDTLVNAADYLVATRIALGLVTATPLDLAHGDMYPVGSPDGVIDMADLTLILQAVLAAP